MLELHGGTVQKFIGDALKTHGEALVDLAEVLSHGGRSDQAAAALGDPP